MKQETEQNKTEQKEQKEQLHSGHRKRIREEFVKNGIEDLSPHKAVELLLFYGIPRIDTNELAHRLVNAFGSLSGIFDASFEELMKIPQMTENAATLIKLIPGLTRAYAMDRHADLRVFDSSEKIGEYFVDKFIGCTSEIIYLMLLDSSLQLISCEIIGRGSVNSSSINIRTIIDGVVRHNACTVVLAHNHPRGLALPSSDDLAASSKVKYALKALEIRFLEHVIVAQSDYISLIADGYIKMD